MLVDADSRVDFVGPGREGGAGAEQSFGSEPGIGVGVDLGLEVDGGVAAEIEATDRDYDLVAYLGGDAVGGGDEGYVAGNLENGLCAVEAMLRAVVSGQRVD